MKLVIFCFLKRNFAELIHECEKADLGEAKNNGTIECELFTCELKCPPGFEVDGGTGTDAFGLKSVFFSP